MHPRFLLILTPLLVGALHGAPENAPPPPDFSNAFVQLAALGMPALDPNAKWSTSPDYQSTNYELHRLTQSMKGNGWLLPSTDGKIRFLPMSAITVIETDPKSKSDSSGDAPKRSIGGGSSTTRPPTPIKDPIKDITSLISAVKKGNGGNEYSRYNVSAEFGDLLLFAAQLHQTGQPQLANELALATFNLFQSREAAVDAAINQIASADYQKAADEFFKSGDWSTYHQSLTKLLDRFPRGWAARDAIGIFLPQLEKQASGTKAPAPTLPDIPLAPQALAIVQEFTEKQPNTPEQPDSEEAGDASMSPEMMYRLQMMGSRYGGRYGGNSSMPSSLWLLDDVSTTEGKKSAIMRLAALKMAALPTLAAIATDPFLTHFPNNQSHSGYYSSDDNSEDRALRAYASLHRPATRGEIAKSLLAATLPDPDDELNNADQETLRDLAISFWKEHQNDTREQLAAVFLREGSRSQSAQAATMLASSKDPAAHQAFEAHILASENALGEYQQLQIYLRSRKAAAKPFFAAYAKLVRSQNTSAPTEENGYDPSSYMIKEAGGMEKILKQLEALVGDQSPRSLAVQIAKGKPEDAEAAIRTLSSLLADASGTKHLFTLLEGANAATDPTVRARFLSATQRINWRSKDDKEDSPPSDRKISEPELKVWQKLIADTREISNDLNPFSNNEKSTVADLAAASLEYSVAPHTLSQAMWSAAAILSKPVTNILRERAEARLSDKPIPPLPDASKIPQQRLAEIVAETAKKLPAEIHPYLKTLSPDERAAWREWTQNPGEIAIPANVKNLRFLVIGRDKNPSMGNANEITAAEIDLGFVLSATNLKAQVEILAKDFNKYSRTVIELSNAQFGPGLEMTAFSVPLPAKKPEDASNPVNRRNSMRQAPQRIFYNTLECIDHTDETDGVILVQLSDKNRTESHWKVTKGIPTTSDTTRLASLNSALADLAESNDFEYLQLTIQILSKADAKIIKEANSDDNEYDLLPNLPN